MDLNAIRHEAERRSLSLRRTIRLEVGFSLLVIISCVLVAASPDTDPSMMLLFSGMAVFLVIYQALMVWIRRRDLADSGRDALSLVDREIQRASTVLRYWRWGMWSSLVMWLTIYGLLVQGMAADAPVSHVIALYAGTAINVPVLAAMGAYGWWRCRQARARLRRFTSLRDLLLAP